MGTPLGPKYIPYTYMDPLALVSRNGRENGNWCILARKSYRRMGLYWSSQGNLRISSYNGLQILGS